ncbi:protein FAM240C [Ochotona curzoniae]|uniref:protein FAM240C n=1 Tax=Ochotona curzoniae TaxID=130825 RepID=UPI001B34FFF3|nr:protein FAM240C [Ochotona curzoniae]
MRKGYFSEYSHARLHDAGRIKRFWEEQIERHEQQLQREDLRVRGSALSKLRLEWTQRLESRNRMLQCPQETPTLFLPSIVPENAPDKAAT